MSRLRSSERYQIFNAIVYSVSDMGQRRKAFILFLSLVQLSAFYGACRDSSIESNRTRVQQKTLAKAPVSPETSNQGEAPLQRPKKTVQERNPKAPLPGERQTRTPTINPKSRIKVNLQPHCESAGPHTTRGWMSPRIRDIKYNEALSMLHEKFPKDIVTGFPSAQDKLVRFLFEPEFLDYQRAQELLKNAPFRVELRPVCKGKKERAALLSKVQQFIMANDHFSQVRYSFCDVETSKIRMAMTPNSLGFQAILRERFGDKITIEQPLSFPRKKQTTRD